MDDEEMGKISDAVVDDLTFDPDVDASDITVEDRDGEVVLAVSVRTVTDDIQIRDDAGPLHPGNEPTERP
jgi:osmotically-inducible protein OsmY